MHREIIDITNIDISYECLIQSHNCLFNREGEWLFMFSYDIIITYHADKKATTFWILL